MSEAAPKGKPTASAKDFAAQCGAEQTDALFYVLVALLLAVAEVLGLYLLLSLIYRTPTLESCIGTVRDPSLPWMVQVLVSRGPLQLLNLTVFAFATNTLMILMLRLPKERRAFSLGYFDGVAPDEEGAPTITDQTRLVPLLNVRAISRDYSSTLPLLVRRMKLGVRRLAEGGDAGEVHSVLQAASEIDRDNLESRFTLVRYLIWLIPTVGFLGTVIGIGLAITRFAGVMSLVGGAGENFQARLQNNLSDVAGQLGMAFDTTMLALLLSALLVAVTSVVQKRQESLLLGIDEFCLHEFVSRIAVSDTARGAMEQVLAGLATIAHGLERVAGTGGTESDNMTLRDIAGLIESQTERIRQAMIDLPGRGGKP